MTSARGDWRPAPQQKSLFPPTKPRGEPPRPKIALDPVQAKVFGEIVPQCFLITGPAGTGKSVLANEIIANLRERKKKVHVTASTGIASIHVGGCTIHSFLGTNICGSVADVEREPWGLNSNAEFRIKMADVIVVDEVSMLTGDYIDMMDWRLRTVCGRDAPFAGKQILFFGDFCLAVGTKIVMAGGSLRAVEDIVLGESVMGPDSKPRKVTHRFGGRAPLYDIHQANAATYRVTGNHQFDD